MKIKSKEWKWTREPKDCSITDEKIEIITAPHTDLWQRTYYHFRNDNAPVLQMKTTEKYFSFIVKTEFESKVSRVAHDGVIPANTACRRSLKTHELQTLQTFEQCLTG